MSTDCLVRREISRPPVADVSTASLLMRFQIAHW